MASIDTPESTYVPVDTSFQARQSWPFTMLTTEGHLNGRELGQFVCGMTFAASMRDERAWLFCIPTDKLAAVSAALVERSFAVARECWNEQDSTTTIAVWAGL